jgi:hypothetical protein
MKHLLKPSGKKCNCGNDISIGRIKYSTNKHICTNCDNTQRVGAIQIINGKVGNTIQIVDQETSARINALQDRKGGIVGAGMKGTAKTTSI